MTQRRRVKQTTTLGDRLAAHADQLRAKAKAMPRGEKELILIKARQFDIAIHINEWLATPETEPKVAKAGIAAPARQSPK